MQCETSQHSNRSIDLKNTKWFVCLFVLQILSVTSSLLLLRIFFHKIKQKQICTNSIDNININIHQNSKHSSTQSQQTKTKFVAIIAKLSCLVFCSMITLISIALIINSGIHYDMAIPALISMLLTSFDITVNSICLLLYWPFADKIYKHICQSCNKFMINKCTGNVNRYVNQAPTAGSRTVSVSVVGMGSAHTTQNIPITQTSANRSVESSIIINSDNQ